MKHINILSLYVKMALINLTTYTFDFWINLINSFLISLANIAVFSILLLHKENIGGWTFGSILILLGIYRILRGITDGFLLPNLGNIPNMVKRGTLDGYLLKPTSTVFLLSFSKLDLWRFTDVLIGFIILGYGMSISEALNTQSVLTALICLPFSVVILYSFWLALMSTSFWLIDIANLPSLLLILFDFGQFPSSVYPPIIKIFLTVALPVFLVTSVPTFLITNSNITFAAGFALLALFLLFLSLQFWKFALSKYTSAGG